jgi:hypothetical protein
MKATPPERKVLLALRDGRIDGRLMVVARGLCERMGAELDILLATAGEPVPADVARLAGTLRRSGINYSLTRREDLSRRDVVDYANSHECIATVLIKSFEEWQAGAADRAANPWHRLACPLVTAASPEKSQGEPP